MGSAFAKPSSVVPCSQNYGGQDGATGSAFAKPTARQVPPSQGPWRDRLYGERRTANGEPLVVAGVAPKG